MTPWLALAVAASVVPALAQAQAETIRANGSSTVYPITAEAASRFQRQRRDVTIEVGFAGTTGGFRPFCEGELDIANASRPINTEELAACEAAGVAFVELPIAVDALAIVVHPSNDWATSITTDELKRLWEPAAEGKITRWNQVREGWPDEPIVLFGRGQDSGTYDYFTGAIVGEVRSSRLDYTASEDIGLLVEGMTNEPNALGFLGVGGFVRNWEELRDVAVDSGSGAAHPDIRSVQAGSYVPLTRPLFLYVNAEKARGNAGLRAFVEFYLQDVARWVVFTGYMPLDDGSYVEALRHFRELRTGTAFDGVTRYDLTVADILARQ